MDSNIQRDNKQKAKAFARAKLWERILELESLLSADRTRLRDSRPKGHEKNQVHGHHGPNQ